MQRTPPRRMQSILAVCPDACFGIIICNRVPPLLAANPETFCKLCRYMTKDGRISMAGLNSARAEYLAQAIDDSVRNY